MIDFAYNQYNEIGKKTVSMQRQEGHSQMKDKSETSTTDLIILFFLLFIISNILFAVACMLLSDDAESNLKLIKDFAISTGSLVGINIVGLILIECFERIEKYIFRRKNQKECFGEGNFQVLRCSSRYYMLPIAVTALDMMFVLSFLHERNKDAQVMIEFFQGRDGIFPLFCMGFFNIYGVYVLAHYCCYKVYCTGYLLEVIHFLRKKSIPWSDIKSIEFFYLDQYKKQRIVINLEKKKIVFRAEVLNDGWDLSEVQLPRIGEASLLNLQKSYCCSLLLQFYCFPQPGCIVFR